MSFNLCLSCRTDYYYTSVWLFNGADTGLKLSAIQSGELRSEWREYGMWSFTDEGYIYVWILCRILVRWVLEFIVLFTKIVVSELTGLTCPEKVVCKTRVRTDVCAPWVHICFHVVHSAYANLTLCCFLLPSEHSSCVFYG